MTDGGGEPAPSASSASGGAEGSGRGLSTFFIRRPVFTAMMTAAMVLVGVAAYLSLPVASLPTVDVATFLVTAELSGADARTNAQAVTNPLEKQFGQIEGLTQMTSASANSYAEITLQFGFRRSVESAATAVQAAITAAAPYLPATLTQPPIYRATNPAATPVLILALTSDTLPLTTVDDYGENILLQQLSRVPGVGLVTIGGQQQPSMRVELDPDKLAALGLTIGDARSAVSQATSIVAKGVLEGRQRSLTLDANDQLDMVAGYDRAIIGYRGNAPVLVRDVGRAEIAAANPLLAGWYDGRRAIILNILLANGGNAVDTVGLIEKEMPRLRAALPAGIDLSIVSDRTKTIRASVSDVERTLLITVGLVVATIFVFLRSLWATVIPGVAMVVALIGTAAAMRALGFSLDNLSLMALSISVGFVVDDAIVMIENISRHLEDGLSPFDAAMKGAGEIGFTIVSITISLIAVFIPIFLMAGVVGRMMREFASTVAIAIVVSAFVSLTLTPTLCAILLRARRADRRHGRLYGIAERGFDRLLGWYDACLIRVLRHDRLALLAMLATVGLTGYLFVVIPKGFFPQQDTGLLTAISEGAETVSIEELGRRQQAATAIILDDAAVASVASYIGPGPGNAASNQGRMFITLKPLGARGPDAGAQQVIDRLSGRLAKLPAIRLFMQSAQDLTIGARTAKATYQYTLSDADAAELDIYADRMAAKLRGIAGVIDVGTDRGDGGVALRLEIDREAAARYGLRTASIDQALNDAFSGATATKVFGAFGQYFVIVEADARWRGGADALQHIYLAGAGGKLIRLAEVAKPSTRIVPSVINHQNQLPSVTISFNLAPGVSIGDAVAAIEKVEGELHPPLTVQGSFEGTANAFKTALAGQVGLIGLALVAIYLILGMLYESWSHPITIISTLPSAGLGALLALIVAGMPLDVIGIIGILLLLGIVKKNGIMMVDFAIEARRRGAGTEDAIHEACRLRFRPILMTTMCALLGGVPLILSSGIGSQIRTPLGVTIVGGLAVSQVLTLFTTPIIHIHVDRLAGRIARMAGARRARRARPT